jgi:predicted 3-demethylubiquinone-9 3-methyltransferase (glyoxalase superfamily)
MQKIVPNLWFDNEAKEAVGFHTTIFPNSRVTNMDVLTDPPSGEKLTGGKRKRR